MDIISIRFVIITLIISVIYYLLSNDKKNLFLALISGLFIAGFNIYYLIYVLLYSIVNYYIGLKLPSVKNKKLLFRTGILINLLQLILFKYSSFAVDPIFELINLNIHVSKISEIFVPLGISYFTLQGIGYLINVKMGWEKPESNFIDFFVYISFFPKFLSGPVERSKHFLPQLKKNVSFSEENVSKGMKLVLFGFFKKVAIANQLAPYVKHSFVDLDASGGSPLLVTFFILPFYLYFDFSGYTDIALGYAKMFGIDLLPNFNRPLLSENVTVFWRRFHMSLSLWFSDYIFKQTMFRRRKWGEFAPVYALLLTWTLFGIWHGAGWRFMVLGMIQAVAIIYEYYTKRWRKRLFSTLPENVSRWAGRSFTFIFYAFSLVFFFSPDLPSVMVFFSNLFDVSGSFFKGNQQAVFLMASLFITIFLIIEILQNDHNIIYKKIDKIWSAPERKNKLIRLTVYFFMMAIVIVLNNEVQDFIYFKF